MVRTEAAARGDKDLARAAASGDPAAQRTVVRRLHGRVRSTVFYLTGGRGDWEDMVQDALVEILRSLRSFRGEASLESWADRITVRTAMRQLKRRHRHPEVAFSELEGRHSEESNEGPPVGLARGPEDPDARPRRTEVRLRLGALLERLPPERRTAVVLRWVHGYSIQEIADMTGVRLNTARGRLRKGKKELRDLILSDPVLRNWRELVEP